MGSRLLIVLGVIGAPLEAQKAEPAAGDRVRVGLRSPVTLSERIEGRYVSGLGGTLVVVLGAIDTMRVPMAEVRDVRVAMEKRRPFRHDLFTGAAIGAGVGLVAGFAGSGGQTVSDPVGFLVWTSAAGAILGGATGFIVALKPRTQWRRVWP